MIASVTSGDHPNIATSGLDSAKSVNRWWTLTTTGVVGAASTSPGTYGATFTFVNPASFDAGANTAVFEAERWTGATWAVSITGGSGNDTLSGGRGNDTYIVDSKIGRAHV